MLSSSPFWHILNTAVENADTNIPPDVFPRVCFHYFSSTHLEWVHFFCGFYNVFFVPCIVLMSEMLSFTMVTKFNYFLTWKLHRFVLYEVVSKASRGSLLQQWFIRFLVFFQSNVFRKTSFFLNAANAFTDPHFFFRHCVAFTNLGSNGQWQAPNWSSGYSDNDFGIKYVPKQSIP